MTINDVKTNVLESEDFSLELVSAGPLNLPRLEGAQLIVQFSRISQNAFRLHRTLENYWKMKEQGAKFPVGSRKHEDFLAIEQIVSRQAPPETKGKQYLPIALDSEAEKRIINIAVGMNLSGVSLRQIQTAFLPRKQISQILDIAKSLEEIQDGEVALFEDRDRPELSALVNLSAITKTPRADNDSVAKTLAGFWRNRRSDYPRWPGLGPIFPHVVAKDIERRLASNLKAQYWTKDKGYADIKIKVENYVQQLSSTLQNQTEIIKIVKPGSSEIIWACGWQAAAEYSGINVPEPSDTEQLAEFTTRFSNGDDLKLLKEWILSQFRTKDADHIRANPKSTIDPTISQFENLLKRRHLTDEHSANDTVFGTEKSNIDITKIVEEEAEINHFSD